MYDGYVNKQKTTYDLYSFCLFVFLLAERITSNLIAIFIIYTQQT